MPSGMKKSPKKVLSEYISLFFKPIAPVIIKSNTSMHIPATVRISGSTKVSQQAYYIDFTLAEETRYIL